MIQMASAPSPRGSLIRAATEDRSAPWFQLELLGGFQLHSSSARVELPLPSQRLLAVLALNDRPMPRSQVAGILWPDVPEERARGNLRSVLWRLGGTQALHQGRAHLALRDDVEVDVRHALRMTRQVIVEEAPLAPTTLYPLIGSGVLLPHWSEDWVLFERERFNQLKLLALVHIGGQLLRRGRLPEATAAAMAAVEAEPLHEGAQQLLIECHLAQGNRALAARHFDAYAALIRSELGMEPAAVIRELTTFAVARGC
jgi:DNA-binding SARP family transcriptional activator